MHRARFLPALLMAPLLASTAATSLAQGAAASCATPLYLTVVTGHMDLAPLVVDVLNRHQVRATFFASNDRATVGATSLSVHWAPWWKARAAEGHEFASRTYEPVAWRGDLPGQLPNFRVGHLSGGLQGREFTWDAKKYCDNLTSAADRLKDFTGRPALPLFRTPDGAASPRLLAVAKSCGYVHVGWSPAVVLAEDRPRSKKARPESPVERRLKTIRPGDILQVGLGGSEQEDAATQAQLEPLIAGLKAQGHCFATLRAHPAYRDWIAAPQPAPAAAP